MSENPYQPSQVEQVDSGQSIGLRRIVALSAAYQASLIKWRYDGFLWYHILLFLVPFASLALNFMVLKAWVFHADDDMMWLIFASMAPWYIFQSLHFWNGGVVLSPRPNISRPLQEVVNSDGIIYASGLFTLKGVGIRRSLLRVPCEITELAKMREKVFSRRKDPFDDQQHSDPKDDLECMYASGQLDPQKEPELVYQHLGFNSEPAMKIHYRDEDGLAKWLVLASPDAGYLQQTLATLPQSFMITLGN